MEDTRGPETPIDLEPIVHRLAHQNRRQVHWHLSPDPVVARTQQRDITRLVQEVRRLRVTIDDQDWTINSLSDQVSVYYR